MSFDQKMIYLDYSATTPVDPVVSAVVREHMEKSYGNASSVHGYGRIAKIILEESREKIAKSIGAEPAEIFFTSGGTEADNHALIGSGLARNRKNKQNHIIISSIEHHAVLDSADYLRSLGFSISHIPVDTNGIIKIEDLKKAIHPSTAVVSIMHVNNEIGSIQPIQEISTILKNHDCSFHSDTVHSFGKFPFSVQSIGVDILSLSAHKIYGPKGVGAIYIKRGTLIDPLLHGGAQERKNRAGTENIPLIAGFAKAVEIADIEQETIYKIAKRCKKMLLQIISQNIDHFWVNGDIVDTVPHILNISLDPSYYELERESVLLNLDMKGIAVSSGSACTSGSIQPSHVLIAMGRNENSAQSAVRFSFGKSTTDEEIERAGALFCSIVKSFPIKSSH